MVLQYVEPWVSDKDISAGERWAQAIAGELEAANFGIICITPENLNSEWILFEAGALSKSMLDGKVIPLLFGLELSDLSGPLSQFQAQKVDDTGIIEIVRSINKVAEKPASTQIVDMLVPSLWPQLQETLSKIPAKPPSDKSKRSQHEILEELVTGVRGINSRMREYDPDLSDRERFIKRRRYRFHPHMFEEIVMLSDSEGDGSLAILMMAGVVREDLPWLAELLTETYREAQKGNDLQASASLGRLRSIIKKIRHSPMFHEMMGASSKEQHMMLEEIPMFIEMTLDRLKDRKMQAKSIKLTPK